MAATVNQYNLETIYSILFNGFEYNLSDDTIENISNIALQVGAPDYVRTPVFQKRENPMKKEQYMRENNGNKKGRRNRNNEGIDNGEWNHIKAFQATKIEEKVGLEAQIDTIRGFLNKMTDKNYTEMRNNIIDNIDKMVAENITNEDMSLLSSVLFDLASTNRFYSKLYAQLYSDLTKKYEIMNGTSEANFDKFTDLFSTIEFVDSTVNYDKFCENNKLNEKRKSLATFYLNMMNVGVISKNRIIEITRNLLEQVYTFISTDDKKNEVDELTETVSILYKHQLYIDHDYEKIDGKTIDEVVEHIAKSKTKDYKSLTNKSLFKFMDMIDM